MIQSYDIILAEDNDSDAELAIRALQRSCASGRLLHVEDGEELLEYVFANGRFAGRNIAEEPRLLIMDLKMPKISGLEALEQIKSNAQSRTIPVVLLTSSREESDIQTAYALGVNSYVVKPVDFDNYIKAVSDIGAYWLFTNQCCL